MRILYWDNRRSNNPLDSFMGAVGQSTDLTDSCGNQLCVGDIVASVEGTLNSVTVSAVVWGDPRIVDYGIPEEDVVPYIIGLIDCKFAKIDYSLTDFLGICEDDLLYGTEEDIMDKLYCSSIDRKKLNEDLWYSTLVKRGIDVDDGHSVPGWSRLKYTTIDDKEYYDRINKKNEW